MENEKIQILKNNNVEVDNAINFFGDMESYNEALKEFLDSLSDKRENLEYYMSEEDAENYAILAHSIKSELKYLGFMKEADVFLEHELKGKENDVEFIKNNFNKLNQEIFNIRDLLKNYFNDDSEDDNEKKKILIADDSSIILNFISKNINDDYEVLRANNGKEAINQIENNQIYAILLDLNMPSLNGFEVLNYLKEKDLIEHIPVVVITGDDTEDTIKKAFSYPILDVLNKPFSEEKIKRILIAINSFYEHR